MAKQGEVKAITTKDAPEFKGEGEEVKKEMLPPLAPQEGKKRTSVITIQRGKAVRIYFEDGKQVRVEPV